MPHEAIRVLKCYAGGQAYCLDIDYVLAIERGSRMRRNPALDGPCGWIARWGKKIPVHALAERLGSGARAQNVGAIVVMDRANPWGMAVERVSRFERPPSQPQPIPTALSDRTGEFLSGVVIDAGFPIPCLSPQHLHPDFRALPAVVSEPPAVTSRRAQPLVRNGPGRLLLFSLQDRIDASEQRNIVFGLSYTQIIEVVSGIDHVELESSGHVLGLIAWRNRPVAVVDARAMFGLDPIALRRGGRLLIARSPRWQTPVAIPIGSEFYTRTLPMTHRVFRGKLPLDLTHARGVFEIEGDQVLVIPDVDAIVRPATVLHTQDQYTH